MSNYTDEEKAALLAAARATLARSANLPPRATSDDWRLPDPAPIKQQRDQQPRDQRLTDYESHRLRVELASMIAAEHSYLLEDLLPVYLAGLIKDIRAEIATAVGELRAEMQVQRTIDKPRRRARKGTVIDLPNPLTRRVS